MQTAVLIQKAIQRQATAKVRLPSPIAQFKVFLNRGAKPSPEEEEKDKTPSPPENEGGINWEGGEPTGEAQGETVGDTPDTPAGGASQDAPEPTQGASEGGAGEPLPPIPETPQGVAKDAPAKSNKIRSATRRRR